MTLNALQALTWSTVAAAVIGALLLASIETNFSETSRTRRAENSPRLSPVDATATRIQTERSQPGLIETTSRREISVR